MLSVRALFGFPTALDTVFTLNNLLVFSDFLKWGWGGGGH